VGAALAIPERLESDDGEFLVEAADAAMYEAKQAGRNRTAMRNLMTDFNRRLLAQVLQRRFSRWLVSRGLLDLPAVSRALLHCQTERVRLGDLARQAGLLTPPEIEVIRNRQEQTGRRFGETAVNLSFLDTTQLANLMAVQQENPRELAVALARLGLLEAGQIQILLDRYEAELGIGRRTFVPA